MNSEAIDLLKKLSKDMSEMKVAIKELQEDNASSAIGAEKMYKNLSAKFDLFKNLETQSRDVMQQNATTTRKPTKPIFFKKIFAEEREKHMNTLYTQEEVDAAFAERDIEKKGKEPERIKAAAQFIYVTHIKANNPEGRLAAFESLYEQTFSK